MKTVAATSDLAAVASAIWDRSRAGGFAGHDPYDGLKSRLLAPLLARSRWFRIAVIQGVKRCPLNLRPVLGIPPGLNPKAIALHLQALADRPQLAPANERERLADLLASLASHPDGSPRFPQRDPRPGRAAELAGATPSPLGWGYDFPWQSKAFLQPAYYPTVVCTSFVIDALAAVDHPTSPVATRSAAAFVTSYLHRHADLSGVCYSYSPRDRTRVFNASLFAGKILARAAGWLTEPEAARYRHEAAAVVDYVVARQRHDGGWIYGEADHWQWIDNFHTGFVLETIADIADLLDEPDRWRPALDAGLAFYRRHLLGDDLTPHYYADRPHVLDSHTVAQAALTLLRFADRQPSLAAESQRVLELGIARLWQPHRRGFAFQQGPLLTNRTVFLRWSQGWMLRAICAQLARQEAPA